MPDTRAWLGRGIAVAQAGTVQITAYDAATTYKLTVGGIVISTIAAGSANATATALAAAWEASTHPYCVAVAATANTDTVTLTANTAGLPFTVTPSVSGGTGTIGAYTATQANKGPSEYTDTANWSGATLPVAGDTIVFENCAVPLLWGLSQAGATMAAVLHYASHTAAIGLNPQKFATTAENAASGSGSTSAPEYRTTSLTIDATIVRTGIPAGNAIGTGSGRIRINTGTVASTIQVQSSPNAATDGAGRFPVEITCNEATTTVSVENGRASIAALAGETSTILTATCGAQGTNPLIPALAPALTIGAGVTWTNLNVKSGTVTNLGASGTTLTQAGGRYTPYGAAAHTTIYNHAGTFVHQATGTIGAIHMAGTCDFSQDPRPKTITNATAYPGASINRATGVKGSITWTNDMIMANGADLQNVTLVIDPGSTIALS